MATVTYRALGANNEPSMGQGQANFISDVDAVAQAIRTRLLLFENEWWENLADGLPLWQKILGYGGGGRNQQAVALIIQSRILGTPHVTKLISSQYSYSSATRKFAYHAVVGTQFGAVAVTNMPQPPSRDPFFGDP